MADTQEIEEKPSEAIPVQQKHETRDEMLSRHRKEISQLQNKEIELKKAAAKGSKAEQKAKKKQVEEEISQLSAKLKEKHAKELASLGYSSSNGNEKSNLDSLVKAVAGVSVTNQPEHSKPSKSLKRREKRAQQEAEREQRIQEEQSNVVSDRMIENEKLEKKLEPLELTVIEIKPDGHCLYRAVEDQLAHLLGGSSPYTYQELRGMVASYMRKNASDFLPFFLSDNMVEQDSDNSLAERFENYCKEIESTAAWGGQLELEALTHCLRKHIMIFSGSFPDVEMGKEYKSDSSNPSIMLSYHRHAFGLGALVARATPLSHSYVITLGVNATVYELDQIPNGQQIESALQQLGCQPSVPAVFIGQQLVGGAKQVMTLHVQYELATLLRRAGVMPEIFVGGL